MGGAKNVFSCDVERAGCEKVASDKKGGVEAQKIEKSSRHPL